jgi:hypothetical protein
VSRVLVACEFSGTVRDAFIRAGHDAMSCDLLPSETPGPHYQGNVLDILDHDWDMLIAHPPCTYLANSGVRWLYGGKGTVRDPERWAQMEQAADFFARLLAAPINRVVVENPVMHGHGHDRVVRRACDRWGGFLRFQVQTIQPWQYGHGETKATQLWRRNLPALEPTDIVDGREQRVHRMPPGPDRWRERSRTFPGIAKAMADQWGPLLLERAA